MKPKIAKVAVAIPLNRLFDYLLPDTIDSEQLQPGMRVKVPFGARSLTGLFIELSEYSDIEPDKLKAVQQVVDSAPLLPGVDIQLLNWASQYYYYPIGEVLFSALPVSLRKGKAAALALPGCYRLSDAAKNYDSQKLKRALSQKQLLETLQKSPNLLFDDQFLANCSKNWKAATQALIQKGLLEEASGPLPAKELNPKTSKALQLNDEQHQAVSAIIEHLHSFKVFLLDGVTGSGKTEVYMQIIQPVLDAGHQVLVLLPEITLTPQLELRFQRRFAHAMAISHSRLSDKQRLNAWLLMQQGHGQILLGTRSALFTPLPRAGLIILDEEHDSSYKQQDGFRYSARDAAIMRAKMLNIPIVLGTATPSFESLENALQNRYRHLVLSQRAGNSSPPDIIIQDIRNKKMREGLSETLIKAIELTLEKNEQVMLFINRRGYAPVLMCHSCGWLARCLHCDANLVIHAQEGRLCCHHCNASAKLIRECPSCKKMELFPLGLGTERVERILQQAFPQKQIVRLDRDTTQRKGSLENFLDQINQKQADIILGTQMLAKGHHFPEVTLVALLDVDSGLFSTDYHAPEKLAQLIVQVSGRAGRAAKPGKVILQTRHPDHPLLQTLVKEGYHAFAKLGLEERKHASLPPYAYQAIIRVCTNKTENAKSFFDTIMEISQNLANPSCSIMGPVSAPMARKAGSLHYQLLFQANRRPQLRALLDSLIPALENHPVAKKVQWSLDVDPIDLY